MANPYNEVYSMLEKIILDVTRFYVARIGEVVNTDDELKSGRILVHIPSLGWTTDAEGAWCFPKDKKSLITPKVGDFVLIEFVDGNKDYPIYSGLALQMKDMLPAAYDGKNTTQILFENNKKDFALIYDESEKILKLGSKDVTESFVKGDTLKTELQKVYDALSQLKTDLTAWAPVVGDNGVSTVALKTIVTAGFLTKLLGTLDNILSEKIKGE